MPGEKLDNEPLEADVIRERFERAGGVVVRHGERIVEAGARKVGRLAGCRNATTRSA
jgi:hypothetical protein